MAAAADRPDHAKCGRTHLHWTSPEREVAILQGMAEGWTNKEIGVRLGFAEKTIRNTASQVFRKLHLRDRAQAAVYAVRHGFTAQTYPVSLAGDGAETPLVDG